MAQAPCVEEDRENQQVIYSHWNGAGEFVGQRLWRLDRGFTFIKTPPYSPHPPLIDLSDFEPDLWPLAPLESEF